MIYKVTLYRKKDFKTIRVLYLEANYQSEVENFMLNVLSLGSNEYFLDDPKPEEYKYSFVFSAIPTSMPCDDL